MKILEKSKEESITVTLRITRKELKFILDSIIGQFYTSKDLLITREIIQLKNPSNPLEEFLQKLSSLL